MISAALDICPPGRTLLYKRGRDIDIRLSAALVLISVTHRREWPHHSAADEWWHVSSPGFLLAKSRRRVEKSATAS
jgi:hypothetical protein